MRGIMVLSPLLFCLLFQANSVSAQKKDSLGISMGLGTYMSSQHNFLPHYLVFGNNGIVDENDRFYVMGEGYFSTTLLKDIKFSSEISFRNEVFGNYNLGFEYKKFKLEVGGISRNLGGLDNDLSSGSLAISRNARPVPMVSLSSDYLALPFTKGLLKFKGSLSHGRLEKERHISQAQLHQKSLFGVLDLDKFIGLKLYSGIVHSAQFGGTSPNGEALPSGFKDYLRVFFGSGIPNPDGTSEGESNALGNHLGVIEIKVEKKIGEHLLTIDSQKIFEDAGSMQYTSFKDFMLGLEWKLPKRDQWINVIHLELLDTRWQGGPGIPDSTDEFPTVASNNGFKNGGRDDHYNNWLYRSGWTHHGNVIGNPLFLTYARTLKFLDLYPDYNVAVSNNRIWAIHGGVEGEIGTNLDFRGLFTYSRNSGTYAGLYEGRFNWRGINTNPNFEYVFLPIQKQFYSMLELSFDNLIKDYPIDLNIKLAADFGDLYNLFGSDISIVYNIGK